MTVSFFLGANTPLGFYSLFNELSDFDLNVIKGSSGSGKSTLIKALISKTPTAGICEKILCSSDHSSLDGAVFHKEKLAVVDGTLPHTAEACGMGKYIVTPPPCLNLEDKRSLINSLKQSKAASYSRAYQYLKGWKEAHDGLYKLLSFDEQKLLKRVSGIVKREAAEKEGEGKIHRRFLDSVSSEGFTSLWKTAEDLASKIYVIDDPYSLGCSFLQSLEREFFTRGYTVFSCMSPLSPLDVRHIIIPELSLAFLTSDALSHYGKAPYRKIHLSSYSDKAVLRKNKAKIKLFKQLKAALLDEAVFELRNARQLHVELESVYRPALDIDKLNRLSEETRLV